MLEVRERTCTTLRGNNRSDFPKGSDTGTKINCTVLKMNKGICAVIKEAWVLLPCRPEPTFNKPTAVPACLHDGLYFCGAAEPDRKQNTHTHTLRCVLLQRNLPSQPLRLPMHIYIDYSKCKNKHRAVICQTAGVITESTACRETFVKQRQLKLPEWDRQWQALIRECLWYCTWDLTVCHGEWSRRVILIITLGDNRAAKFCSIWE